METHPDPINILKFQDYSTLYFHLLFIKWRKHGHVFYCLFCFYYWRGFTWFKLRSLSQHFSFTSNSIFQVFVFTDNFTSRSQPRPHPFPVLSHLIMCQILYILFVSWFRVSLPSVSTSTNLIWNVVILTIFIF